MSKKSYLIDTNVALDLLLSRQPFDIDAVQIFTLASAGEVELQLSTDAISTLAYVITKNKNNQTACQAIALLLDYVTLVHLDEPQVLKGLALDFADIEDGLVAAVADAAGAKAIITRNAKDLAKSPIPAISPKEFLAIWAQENKQI